MTPSWLTLLHRMRFLAGIGVVFLSVLITARNADANPKLKKLTLRYKCDSVGTSNGLSKNSFLVEYVAGEGKSLAIIPVHHHPLTFTRVPANYGAIYISGNLRWFVPGGGETKFSTQTANKTFTSKCEQLTWTERGNGGWPAPSPTYDFPSR